MNRLLFFLTLIVAVGLSLTVLRVSAQNPAMEQGLGPNQDFAGQERENDQSRGVARISVLHGEVSVRRGDSGDVVAAALNAPMLTGDRLLTSSSSRAEVQFDRGHILRVGSNSEVRMNDIEQGRSQVQIAIGTVTFRVVRNAASEIELDTPSLSFRPLVRGSYRVTVRDDGSTELSVREGEAEMFGPRGSERLQVGTTILARGSADDPEFRDVGPIPLDDWDRWNESRDRQLESSRSYDYVSPDITGAEDLEGYGRWAADPQYGNVWVPRVESGWAPYRSGRWAWEDYYGWTWISHDPWGWAPYHYGRWFNGAYGWAWYPGARHARQYWSPALVAFIGFGGSGGLHSGFGFGNVGWVPLAPYERCHPWWGRGVYSGLGSGFDRAGRFGNQTTIVNTNITNIYRNARVSNAITAVDAHDFGRGHGEFRGLNGAAVRDAGLVRGILPVRPDRSSLRLSDRAVRLGAFPVERNVNFAGRRTTLQTPRVPFEQQQRGIDQMARRVGGSSQTVPPISQPASPQGSFSQRDRTNGATSHGWSRFGEPIHNSLPDSTGRRDPTQVYSGASGRYNRAVDPSTYRQLQPDRNANSPTVWHRFGQPTGEVAPDVGSARRFGGAATRYQTAPDSTYQPSVRISPPMVHERQRSDDVQSRRSLGGSSRAESAPPSSNRSYSQPAQQPSPSRDYSRREFSGARQGGGDRPSSQRSGSMDGNSRRR